jgi:hypothetical protein
MKEEMGTSSVSGGTTTSSIPDPKDTVQGPSKLYRRYRVLDKRYKKDGKRLKLLKKFKEIRD